MVVTQCDKHSVRLLELKATYGMMDVDYGNRKMSMGASY